jgi:geranylgeranyl pyrophosphate synthase
VASAADKGPELKDTPSDTTCIKVIPQARDLRERIRVAAVEIGRSLDRRRPLTRQTLHDLGLDLLHRLSLDEAHLGFAMVAISNEFWQEQVQAIDFSRRLLLLPHCLREVDECPAEYDEINLHCQVCGACPIGELKVRALALGYQVLVSEGTPAVLKIIVNGQADAIIGVACLNVLEKALDKVLRTGIPCLAVPLLSCHCRNTSVDSDWVMSLIELRTAASRPPTRSYVHLLRAANQICEEPELSRLAPRSRGQAGQNGTASSSPFAADPLSQHETIAYDWLSQGGKRSRPFITLAVYDALRGAPGTVAAERLVLPDAVKRIALAIEAFHKASLVHDDIEDDDTFRYGRATLHRQYGVGTAINVGDYLIGLGYRLVSRERTDLGGDCIADILGRLSEAHLKLSEGQGAELLWRDARDKALTPLEALKIYALKTAPAFEAALYTGVRLAGPAGGYEHLINDFSKDMGVAFQILNDLKDWEEDGDNKLVAGSDVRAARPTLLLALALERSGPDDRAELLTLIQACQARAAQSAATPDLIDLEGRALVERIGWLFTRAEVFARARQLVEKYRLRATKLADQVQVPELRELLLYLVDVVLHRPPDGPAEVESRPSLRTIT